MMVKLGIPVERKTRKNHATEVPQSANKKFWKRITIYDGSLMKKRVKLSSPDMDRSTLEAP